MKRFLTIGALALLVASLAVMPAAAGQRYSKVKGQVVKVEQQVRTANGGEFDRLTIRTRQGEQLQLQLGQGGACEGCFQAGDRVRARVHSGDGSGGGYQVQSMKVRRGGDMYGYVNANGKIVQDRGGPGTRNGDRVRDRIHEPGSGDCPGCAAGQRGGGGRRSGGRGGRGGGSG